MVTKRRMRQLISRGRREQIERVNLERLAQLQDSLGEDFTVFQAMQNMNLREKDVKRLLRKLQKINMMPTTMPQKLKKENVKRE